MVTKANTLTSSVNEHMLTSSVNEHMLTSSVNEHMLTSSVNGHIIVEVLSHARLIWMCFIFEQITHVASFSSNNYSISCTIE